MKGCLQAYLADSNLLITNCTFRSNSFLSTAFCFAWRIRSTCFPDIPLRDPRLKSQVQSHLTGSDDSTSSCGTVDAGDSDRKDSVTTDESSSSIAIRSGSGTITGVERPEDNCPRNDIWKFIYFFLLTSNSNTSLITATTN